MYKSTGILKYFNEEGRFKLIVEIDQNIVDYYRAITKRFFDIRPQKYPAHISIVRKEVPLILEPWGKYNNKSVEFYYDGIIYSGTVYFWINTFSVELEQIRIELGLPVDERYIRPPVGFNKTFHISIGNIK